MHKALLPLLTALTLCPLVHAATLDEQRQLFNTTLAAAERGQDDEVDKGLRRLKNYPLVSYIRFEQLSGRLQQLTPREVERFNRDYGDTPLAGRLRWMMTTELGRREDWSAFETLYTSLNKPNAEQQCYYGRALLAQGKTQQGMNLAASLWSVGHSQPDNCDPLFASWMQRSGLSDPLALKRTLSALQEGNPSLASYASRKIQSAPTARLAELARQLYEQPDSLLRDPALVDLKTPHHRELLMLAVARLRRSDLDGAIQLWLRDRQRLAVPLEEQTEITTGLALRKAKRFEPDAEAALARLDAAQTIDEITEWRIRLALTRQDWLESERLIGRLSDSERHADRWRYWRAIARKRQGLDVNQELVALSAQRSFYGFLAAELSHSPFKLNHEPARFAPSTLTALEQQPAFRRIAELYALGRLYEARSEWNLARTTLTPEQQHAAAHLAKRWGWHNQAIRGAIQSEQWNDLDLRFPNPFPSLFDSAAKAKGIDPTWATAIARQESAFWISARSRVGARGLMQLMPQTASQTAKRHGLKLGTTNALYDPAINIPLGSAYLSDMYQRFDNNRVFATAAYNAGPHRVSRWLEQRGDLPLDIWIETIPFDETRNYVQNVLSFAVVYDRLADRPARLLSDSERETLAFHLQPKARNTL